MPLSWIEIRHRAIRFARDWAGTTSESAEKQTFWNEFLDVFGIRRRTVASFEAPVKQLSGQYGFIDLFWRGVLLVEHKSFGGHLGRAESQAFQYIQDLTRAGRHKEIPRYILVTDFARIALHDLDPEEQRRGPGEIGQRAATIEFPLSDLCHHIHAFAFIPGYKQHTFREQDPINIEAVEMLGNLHDTLEAGGYSGHDLDRFLVRVLFCLFAEDTALFEREGFRLYLENRTAEDGSDLGPRLAHLFDVLNTPVERRQTNLDDDLRAFPYVNGDLFAEPLRFAAFNRDMRNALLACTRFDWSRISPAIFGSLFQSVMEPRERRQIGGHYTSERDILKVIRSLFLDDLRAEFDAIKADQSTRRRTRLEAFHQKLSSLRFLDPACGCGNFLVITYRELRQLELDVLKELFPAGHGGERGFQQVFSAEEVAQLTRVDVDQFYGIEIGEWPARIAEVALWLMDHQMNLRVSEAFGQLYQRLPLRKSPHIHVANALRTDWRTVLPPDRCSYVLGNPPFVGKHYQNKDQKADMLQVFRGFKNLGDVDYVVSWFYRAAEYIQETRIKVGLVATNSVTQGEQVPLVWGLLFDRFKVKIHFAHRTFAWQSEARGQAHVHVVIIGFGTFDPSPKPIFDYETDPEQPTVVTARNISPYLTPGPDAYVTKRTKPLCEVPEMRCGNKPSDGGHLILTDEERDALLKDEPAAGKFLRRFTGSEEFINGNMRWCLWLKDASPAELRALPKVVERVQRVREFRLRSSAAPTRKAASNPGLFFYISQPTTRFIAIPEVSSERRPFIPLGFLPPEVIVSNKIYLLPTPNLYAFGLLSCTMHMAWVRQIAGRLESRYQYSGSMVYNNYPWPQEVTDPQRAAVEASARRVLDVRAEHLPPKGNATLADLYDPLAMPADLVKAHAELDRAGDRCYRKEPFRSDRERVEHLFALYEKLTAPLAAAGKPKRAARRKPAHTQPEPSPRHPSLTEAQAAADAAHFYSGKEEPPAYRTGPA
ncbi:MAG: class I SAM-dependent DNA methyltransferase [Verrucomicrobia bacterium]|jgi:hypothetical protein|nr:class I SAM-dependent DNA methyltransferase [Verrucomicrobiota bacterium]